MKSKGIARIIVNILIIIIIILQVNNVLNTFSWLRVANIVFLVIYSIGGLCSLLEKEPTK